MKSTAAVDTSVDVAPLESTGGATFSSSGLRFDRAPGKAELDAVRVALLSLEHSSPWWWGDYLLEVARHHEAERIAAGKRAGKTGVVEKLTVARLERGSLEAFAETAGLAVQSLKSRKWVAGFYSLENRIPGVSYAHHQEAISAGSLKSARRWLERAKRDGMSPAEMRRQIRAASVNGEEAEPPPSNEAWGGQLATAMGTAGRLLAGVAKLNPSGARRLLDRIASLASLVDILRQRAALAA